MNEARINLIKLKAARAKGDLASGAGPVATNQGSQRHRSKKTLADRVDQLERLIARLSEKAYPLPRLGHPELGNITLVLGCECAFCAHAQRLRNRRNRLSDIHARLIADIVAARLRTSRAASKKSSKINSVDYERCRANARSRKELASLLGVTLPGLAGWERRHRKNIAK